MATRLPMPAQIGTMTRAGRRASQADVSGVLRVTEIVEPFRCSAGAFRRLGDGLFLPPVRFRSARLPSLRVPRRRRASLDPLVRSRGRCLVDDGRRAALDPLTGVRDGDRPGRRAGFRRRLRGRSGRWPRRRDLNGGRCGGWRRRSYDRGRRGDDGRRGRGCGLDAAADASALAALLCLQDLRRG